MALYYHPDEIADGTDTAPGGGKDPGFDGFLGGNDLARIITDLYSANNYAEGMQDGQDSLDQALARLRALRLGLNEDSSKFYDKSMEGLRDDFAALMPQVGAADDGAERAERYGPLLTQYANQLMQQGLGRIDQGVAAGQGKLDSARDAAIGNVRGVFDPAMARAGDEIGYQRKIGGDLINAVTNSIAGLRAKTDPMLASTAFRYQMPNQYSAEGIRGLLSRAALRGVEDTYDDVTGKAVTEALRTGTSAGALLEALGRQRSRESETALMNAEVAALGKADELNQRRRQGEAASFAGISGAQTERERLLPSAVDVASRGSLGANSLAASLAGNYASALNAPAVAHMGATGDMQRTGITAGNDLVRTGMGVGAQGFDLSGKAAVAGDSQRNNILQALINNYFAGGRSGASDFNQNLRTGTAGEMGSIAGITGKKADLSSKSAQTDPFGAVAGNIAGKVGGKIIDWGIDQIWDAF